MRVQELVGNNISTDLLKYSGGKVVHEGCYLLGGKERKTEKCSEEKKSSIPKPYK